MSFLRVKSGAFDPVPARYTKKAAFGTSAMVKVRTLHRF